MIETVSDFLLALIRKEQTVLASSPISHGPTIGNMYEGLSRSILERTFPHDLGLRLVSGFISGRDGGLSGQIDCMLVSGSGLPIPYTDSFVWPIQQVIAVFEIKKNFYSADLKDSFAHLARIRAMELDYRDSLRGDPTATFDPTTVRRSFSEISHRSLEGSSVEALSRDFNLESLYRTLVNEHHGIIRIVVGHRGFSTEHSFRTKIYDYLNENLGQPGFGVGSFPQLILCGQYSFVKANGEPYALGFVEDDWWPFCFTSSYNPVRFLLELLWTRLEREYGIGGLWGDDMLLETPHAFLLGRARIDGSTAGWDFRFVNTSPQSIASLGESERWQPQFLTDTQGVVILQLIQEGRINLDDRSFKDFLTREGCDDPQKFVTALTETQLVACSIDGGELRLTTTELALAVLGDGRIVAAENNTGRLTRWLRDSRA